MSWDEIKRTQHKCPCGQSTYTVISLMNDWGGHKERWTMNCPECNNNFRLYTYWIGRHSGDEVEKHFWVPVTDYQHVEQLKMCAESARVEATEVAQSRYLNKWLLFFEDSKSKKDIWRKLTNAGEKAYPSLPTFYAHVQDKDIKTYLRDWFTYHNLPDILRMLGVEDAELNERLRSIDALQSEYQEALKQLKLSGFN